MKIFRRFYNRKSLKIKVLAIKEDIENIIPKYCGEKFEIHWYGAYDINPKHLVYWVCIETDREKTKLQSDMELNTILRNILKQNQYPSDAQNNVIIDFESQETVDRISNGNWWYHFK